MNRTLTDFLNHGILPFVGRGKQLDQLSSFWKGRLQASGLRAALVIGEAGVGKSRLLEEFLPHIPLDGGLVIRIKLHPESAASIPSLLTRSLWYSDFGQYLLKKEPEETLPSVVAALRRLIRLRPTMLVIEDIHLLDDGTVHELASLLGALADEMVTLLLLARPVEMAARKAVQRYLVEEMRLEGLEAEVINDLWKRLFEDAPSPEVLESLWSATVGNSLALRSALRAALTSQTITIDDTGGAQTIEVRTEVFTQALLHDVDLISNGMTAHLSLEERHAAEQLACLGEVFSREAARILLPEREHMVDTLLFKGVLAFASPSVSPLPGSSSEHPPLTFTHTLIHKSFAQSESAAPELLARLLIDTIPLYTLHPLHLLAGHDLTNITSVEVQIEIVEKLNTLASALNRSFNWESSRKAWRLMKKIFESVAPCWPEDERMRMTRLIVVADLIHHWNEAASESFGDRVEKALTLTTDPVTPVEARQRLTVLNFDLNRALDRADMERTLAVVEEAKEILSRFPDSRSAYVPILSSQARWGMLARDRTMLRSVEALVQEATSRNEIDEEFRRGLTLGVEPYLLLLFDDPDELEQRKLQLARLEADPASAHSFFRALRVEFLFEQGLIHPMLRSAKDALVRSKDEIDKPNTTVIEMHRLPGMMALGMPLERVEAEAIGQTSERVGPSSRRLSWIAWEKIASVGWLRGEEKWVARMFETMVDSEFRSGVSPLLRLMYALSQNTRLEELADLVAENRESEKLTTLLSSIVESLPDQDGMVELLRSILAIPPLRFTDLLRQRFLLLLLNREGKRLGTVQKALQQDIHATLLRSLEWLDKRRLPLLMGTIISDFGDFLGATEVKSWKARITELQEEIDRQAAEAGVDSRAHVSMLGTIEVEFPNQEPWRPKGSRIRTLLGLMVANEMLDAPLTHHEFCALATGITDDHDQARRVMNVAVFRLRESLGHCAVDTGEITPRLNLEALRVDLLDAHRLLGEAAEALRDGLLVNAVPAVREALGILKGEVAFPSLYEEFFEAARQDIEQRLRTEVLRTSRSLLREGDAINAESILRPAFDAMPEDEELADMLCSALITLNRRTEADRIKRRIATEV